MSRTSHIIVSRDYRLALDDCARALRVLLDQSVMKVADKPAHEPVGGDGAKIKEDSASENYSG